MPDGSQSWKIIKTSASSSGRIAQACDRCRSKKIKCDGKLPQCTQCISVGFECKTSDKLSRRAFPRGYTETLESRVRTLEKELRDVTLQLERSKQGINSTRSTHAIETNVHSKTSLKARLPNEEDDDIVVDEVYRLLSRSETSNGSFLGSSSGRPFFELFRKRLQVSKNVLLDFDEVLPFHKRPSDRKTIAEDEAAESLAVALPPKPSAQKFLNAFFDDWAPLFPILHRPLFQSKFDAMYSEKASKDPVTLAQIWLVLAIAARDSAAKGNCIGQEHGNYFSRALQFLRQLQSKDSVDILKALILAQLYLFAEEDYDLLWHYKTLAVGSAYKLGLHRCQKKLKLGPLTTEMRKRVFWSLYVLDAFSSSIVGLPQLLDDRQIDTEFPADLDDEYVTEMGVLPSPPGNFSIISAAIAFFRVSRILSRLLCEVYSPRRVSLRIIHSIEDELNEWRNGLPGHLRVDHANALPKANNIHSHAPMLLFVYHWMRTLLLRPVLASTCLKKDETRKAKTGLGESSRRVIAILSSLYKSQVPFSLCLSSDLALWASCISILELTLVHDKSSSIEKAGSKAIDSAMTMLRQQQSLHNRKVLDKRILLLEQCLKAFPTAITDTKVTKVDPPMLGDNISPSPLPTAWPSALEIPSNTPFNFDFMRAQRLSESSFSESIASSFDPSTQWSPTGLGDRSTGSPDTDTKNDILESFLSSILDDPNVDDNDKFNLLDSSPRASSIIPSIFDWSNPTLSDDDGQSTEVSPSIYLPMFLGGISSESSPEDPLFQGDTFDFKDSGFPDRDGSHIRTAPNLFSEETGWAI